MTTTDPHSTVLQLNDVTRTYPSGKSTLTALDRVTIGLRRGSWTAIMGPSGSGKSTLLNSAAGLDAPDSGRILLNGEDIASLSDDVLTRMRRTEIGFIFQQFNLVAALSAAQNVALPLRLAGRRDANRAAAEALNSVGLGKHTGHKPRELSGGQQQRVAIARALATRPSILFADEPTGALDSASAATVLDLLRALVDEQAQTILMVTHDPSAAARADQVAFLRDGRLVTTLNGADANQIAATLAELETLAGTGVQG
ncbi:ABC transporter ATP-binding protein [Arthrobacter crusticola]|uniref:ABC transporter ATP-binding protein n=1 Tax=Arthrobacter crusticola TaxID=2547960 RepID=A0A4R5TNV3_9MICC|nr:ABC transporter ATP-binding protein [Arthrobacter crusticola]TDK23684.1 ABC transporter ATP-binding protein [Arthrobacter crusticola]